ncbi:FHA domain-containing protein [uncultured Acetatifactor sp.]|jgi:hypothetical protein|uniref:FHA domain-containing protein n=1 Tax=uncultured Acetatifactor sp. TaxID=1671927 RepID=UPI00262E5E67|nr:FHA domain-containing protein [uncultured Acetatifactor sp.]
MAQKKKGQSGKRILDILILLSGVSLEACFYWLTEMRDSVYLGMALVLICMVAAMVDFALKGRKRDAPFTEGVPEAMEPHGIRSLVLLDEQGKPIRSWDMQGRTALIIGKAGQGQRPDVDLSDCAYSSFVDFQHAILNFCLDQWYVEDAESHNGVKVEKAEDGECYKVIHHPCRVSAGDILHIANTRLLLT